MKSSASMGIAAIGIVLVAFIAAGISLGLSGIVFAENHINLNIEPTLTTVTLQPETTTTETSTSTSYTTTTETTTTSTTMPTTTTVTLQPETTTTETTTSTSYTTTTLPNATITTAITTTLTVTTTTLLNTTANISSPENQTTVAVGLEKLEKLLQGKAVVGKPVKWKRIVTVTNHGNEPVLVNITTAVPAGAMNITVVDMNMGIELPKNVIKVGHGSELKALSDVQPEILESSAGISVAFFAVMLLLFIFSSIHTRYSQFPAMFTLIFAVWLILSLSVPSVALEQVTMSTTAEETTTLVPISEPTLLQSSLTFVARGNPLSVIILVASISLVIAFLLSHKFGYPFVVSFAFIAAFLTLFSISSFYSFPLVSSRAVSVPDIQTTPLVPSTAIALLKETATTLTTTTVPLTLIMPSTTMLIPSTAILITSTSIPASTLTTLIAPSTVTTSLTLPDVTVDRLDSWSASQDMPIVLEDIIDGDKTYEITYETPAPELLEKTETRTDDFITKPLSVRSEFSYQNVTSYIMVPESLAEQVKLYWHETVCEEEKSHAEPDDQVNLTVVEGLVPVAPSVNCRVVTRDVTHDSDFAVEMLDLNENGLIDALLWNVPHLSEQNFTIEIDLRVLNVQSYPTLYGDWVVRFTTTGRANLTITAVNGTAFGSDLAFKELRCGGAAAGAALEGQTVSAADYYCNTTSYFVSRVLTPAKHTLKFTFLNVTRYAYNSVESVPTSNATVKYVYITSDSGLPVSGAYQDIAFTNNTLMCNNGSVSADTRSVHYRWYRNGVLISGAGGSALAANQTAAGDSIYCTAVAEDNGTSYARDSNTLLLCSFDNSVKCTNNTNAKDESSNYSIAYSSSGRFGQAVIINDTANLTYTTAGKFNQTLGTIDFWFRPNWGSADIMAPNGTANYTYLFDVEDASGGNMRFAYYDNDYPVITKKFVYWTADTTTWVPMLSAPQNFNAGNWVHIAMTYDVTGSKKLYVNGVLDNSSTASWTANSPPTEMYIGSKYTAAGDSQPTFQCNCSIDELRLSNIERTVFSTPRNGTETKSTERWNIYINETHWQLGWVGNANITDMLGNITLNPDVLNTNQSNLRTVEHGVNESWFNTTGLVGLWHLDNSTADASGMGNNGIALNGASCGTGDAGKFGTACSFRGGDAGDVINASWSSSLNFTQQVTVSAWIYPLQGNGTAGSTHDYRRIVTNEGAGGEITLWLYSWQDFQWQVQNDTTGCNLWASSNNGSAVIEWNKWQHVTATFNAGDSRIYFNGVFFHQNTCLFTSLVSTNNDMYIGGKSAAGNRFNGTIDDVAVFNRALSADEISRLWQHGSAYYAQGNWTSNVIDLGQEFPNNTMLSWSGLYPYGQAIAAPADNTTGLLGLWHLDNSTADASGLGNTAIADKGTVCNASAMGRFGVACSFDGSNDIVNATARLSNETGTIELWLRPNENADAEVYFSSPSSLSNASDGLLGLWHLDNSTADASGLGNDGTLAGNIICNASVPGKFSTACRLDGTDDTYVNIADANSLTPFNQVTVSAWIYQVGDNANNFMRIVAKDAVDNGEYVLWLYTDTDKFIWYVNTWAPANYIYSTTININKNQWYHVAGTFEGGAVGTNGTLKIYINGLLDNSGYTNFTNITNTANVLRIGNNAAGTRGFNGSIDEVAIFNRSLNENEIFGLAYGSSLFKNTTGALVFTTGNSTLAYIPDGWTNKWHHIAGSWASGTAQLYTDGMLRASSSFSAANNVTGNIYIGNNEFATNATNGLIDEVAVWNRSLSADELLGRYHRGAANITFQLRSGRTRGVLSYTTANRSYAADASQNLTQNFTDWSEWSGPDYTHNGNESLVLGLDFSEMEGNTTRDRSNYGNNGTIYGPDWTHAGKHGSALVFDGRDDYVNVTTGINYASSSGFTWSAWITVNESSPTAIRTAMAYMNTTGCGDFRFGINDSSKTGFTFLVDQDPADCSVRPTAVYNPSGGIAANQWYHIAGVADYANNNIIIYVNGVSNSTPFTYTVNSGTLGYDLQIGRMGADIKDYYWSGTIDSVAIWNRSLSAEEVRLLALDRFTNLTGQPAGDINRYVQVRAFLESGDTNVTPMLNDYVIRQANYSVVVRNTLPFAAWPKTPVNNSWSNSRAFAWNYTTGKLSGEVNESWFDTTGLVGLWHLNNGTQDYSGMGNHGALVGGTNCSVGTTGKFGTACSFRGGDAGDVINASWSNSLNFTQQVTVSAWIYPLQGNDTLDSTHDYRRIVTNEGAGGEIYLWLYSWQDFQWAIQNDTTSCSLYASSDNGSAVIEWNKWQHVTTTFNAGDSRIYINGVFFHQNTCTFTSLISTNNDMYIGGKSAAGNRFNGTIDEVAIWNRSLTAQEIQDIYDMGKARYELLVDDDPGFAVPEISRLALNNFSEFPDCNAAGSAFACSVDNYTLLVEHFETLNATRRNNGTTYANTTIGSGRFGSGFVFDKPASHISYGANYINASQGTAEFWYRSGLAVPAANGTLLTAGGISVFRTTGYVVFNASATTVRAGINDNTWHHIGAVWDAVRLNSTKLYVDGMLKNSTALTTAPAIATIYIGSNGATPANASIDELRISSVPRYGAGELQELNYTELTASLMPDKTYYWKVRSNDLNNASFDESYYGAWSEVGVLKLDMTVPVVALQKPLDSSWNTSSTIPFLLTLTETNPDNCDLYTNSTGSWLLNATNSTPISGLNNITSLLYDGGHLWNVYCNDSAGNNAWAAANFTVNVDTVNPVVAINTPATGNWSKDSWLPFNYSITEINKGVCQIYVNSTGSWLTNSSMNTNGLVGLWHLDNSTADASGKGNHGTGLNNINCSATVSGKFSAACSFDGGNDYINVSDSATIDVSSALTLGVWFKASKNSVSGAQMDLAAKWLADKNFTASSSWSTYDPKSNGVGTYPVGYMGAAFDGRYVYFAPFYNGTAYHGEILRYDSTANFTAGSSWSTYNPKNDGVSVSAVGYSGGVFDGRYIYFVPYHNGTRHGGEVLRYDTTASFTASASWSTYDPKSNGVGTYPVGYMGAVFDGRYIYFAPLYNGTDYHGEVLRYDTTASFTASASWSAFDAGANGVGSDPDGYIGAVFDGRYVYFVPDNNGTDYHGEVLRYDTTASFTASASWSAFDAGANGVGTDPDGYRGAVFDGRYIYFAPYNTSVMHGEVLRYDTAANFTAGASWSTYDAGANGIGTDPDGYAGAMFDGRYVYFVPYHNGTDHHGEVLRYDTTASFTASASWSAFDAGANGVGSDPDGYIGAVFDGRYIYFAPFRNGTGADNEDLIHGEVLRYDTAANASYKLSYAQNGQDSGFSGAAYGITGIINMLNNSFSVSANENINDGRWHHAVLAYNGSALKLFVDSIEKKSISAPGSILQSEAPLVIGGMYNGKTYFNGSIDEVAIWNRSLSADDIKGLGAMLNPTVSAETAIFYQNFTDGGYKWNVWCNDTAGRSSWAAANFTVNVDTINPAVTLQKPATGNWSKDAKIPFNYTAADTNLRSCQLYTNSTGSWAVNQSNASAINESWFNTAGLVGLWHLDNSTADNSGIGNILTAQNGAHCGSDATGKFGTACNFDGVNDVITNTSAVPALYLNQTGTISAWVKSNVSTTGGGFNGIVSATDNGGGVANIEYSLDWDSTSQLRGIISDGTAIDATGATWVPVINQWHHVVFAFNSTRLMIYLDGAEFASAARTISFIQKSQKPVYIGKAFDNDNIWNGSIDEVAIFNRSLSAAEVAALAGITNVSGSGLNSYFSERFNDGGMLWNVYCEDAAGRSTWAAINWTFNVDTVDPAITLSQPLDNSWNTSSTIPFLAAVTEINPDHCNLYTNSTGSWALNASNSTPVNGVNNITSFIYDGGHLWNVWCNDTAGRSSWAAANFTVNVDTLPPRITGLVITSALSSGEFAVVNATVDDVGIGNGRAWMTVNTSRLLVQNYSMSNTTLISFNYSNLLITYTGAWSYKVLANDTFGHTNESAWTAFTVNMPAATITFIVPARAQPGNTIRVYGNLSNTDIITAAKAFLQTPAGFSLLAGYAKNITTYGNLTAGQGIGAEWFIATNATSANYTLNATFEDEFENIWKYNSSVKVQYVTTADLASATASGSIYAGGEQVRILASCMDSDNHLIDSTANATVYYPNNSAWINNQQLTQFVTGLHNYTATAPTTEGTYTIWVRCYQGANFADAMGEIQIPHWVAVIGEIKQNITDMYGRLNQLRNDTEGLFTNTSAIWGRLSRVLYNLTNLTVSVGNVQGILACANATDSNVCVKLNNISSELTKVNTTVNTIWTNISTTVNPRLDAMLRDITAVSANISDIHSMLSCANKTEDSVCARLGQINTTVNTINSGTSTIQSMVNNMNASIQPKLDSITGNVTNITMNTDSIIQYLNCANQSSNTVCDKLNNISIMAQQINNSVNSLKNGFVIDLVAPELADKGITVQIYLTVRSVLGSMEAPDTTPNITIYDVVANNNDVAETYMNNNPSTGVYYYNWSISTTENIGNHVITAKIVESGNTVYAYSSVYITNYTETLNYLKSRTDQLRNDTEGLFTNTSSIWIRLTQVLFNLTNLTVDVHNVQGILACENQTGSNVCVKLNNISSELTKLNNTANLIWQNITGSVLPKLDHLDGDLTTISQYTDTLEDELNCVSPAGSDVCTRLNTIQGYTDSLESETATIKSMIDNANASIKTRFDRVDANLSAISVQVSNAHGILACENNTGNSVCKKIDNMRTVVNDANATVYRILYDLGIVNSTLAGTFFIDMDVYYHNYPQTEVEIVVTVYDMTNKVTPTAMNMTILNTTEASEYSTTSFATLSTGDYFFNWTLPSTTESGVHKIFLNVTYGGHEKHVVKVFKVSRGVFDARIRPTKSPVDYASDEELPVQIIINNRGDYTQDVQLRYWITYGGNSTVASDTTETVLATALTQTIYTRNIDTPSVNGTMWVHLNMTTLDNSVSAYSNATFSKLVVGYYPQLRMTTTQYAPADPVLLYAYLEDGATGFPMTNANITLDVVYPNVTVYLADKQMSEYGSGIYYYAFNAPSVDGTYLAIGKYSSYRSQIAFDVDSTLASVNRSLSDVIGSMNLSIQDVLRQLNVTLRDVNATTRDIYNYLVTSEKGNIIDVWTAPSTMRVGVPTNVSVKIFNEGNRSSNYKVRVRFKYSNTIKYSVNDVVVALAAQSQRTYNMSEQFTPDVAGDHSVEVTLQSIDGATTYDTRTDVFSVPGELLYDVSVRCLTPDVGAGSSSRANITFTNFGDFYTDVTTRWWLEGPGGTVAEGSTPLAIYPHQSRSLVESLSVPSGAPAGTYYYKASAQYGNASNATLKTGYCTFTVFGPSGAGGSGGGGGGSTGGGGGEVAAAKVYNMSITAPEAISIGQDESMSFKAIVKNTGNQDIHNVSTDLLFLDKLWYTISAMKPVIKAGASETYDITLSVPAGAGLKNITFVYKANAAEMSVQSYGNLMIVPEKDRVLAELNNLERNIIEARRSVLEAKQEGKDTRSIEELLDKADKELSDARSMIKQGNWDVNEKVKIIKESVDTARQQTVSLTMPSALPPGFEWLIWILIAIIIAMMLLLLRNRLYMRSVYQKDEGIRERIREISMRLSILEARYELGEISRYDFDKQRVNLLIELDKLKEELEGA